jgi:hypothetical protein
MPNRTNLLGWLSFSVLHLFNAMYHRMWGDELQGWGLVVASKNLGELHDWLYLDGHPAVFYLALWPLTQVTHNPVALQLVSGLASLVFLGLLWFHSPFKAYQKVLISLSFQVGFNMSVVSRSYVLGVLLVFTFAALLPYYRKHPWLAWCCLAVLANVHVYYAVASFCIALAWVHLCPQEDRPLRGLPIYALGLYYCTSVMLYHWKRIAGNYHPYLVVGLPILASLVIWLSGSPRIPQRTRAWLAPAIGWGGLFAVIAFLNFAGRMHGRSARGLIRPLADFGRGNIPVVNPFQPDYWQIGIPTALGVVLALITLTITVLYFRKQPYLISQLLFLACFMLVVFNFLIPGQTWHSGIFFICLLGFCWMTLHFKRELGAEWLLLFILVPQAAVGSNAMIRSKFAPISNCYQTAQWLQKEKIDLKTVIGAGIFPTLGVGAYLERPLYYPVLRRRAYHSTWNKYISQRKSVNRIVKRMKNVNLEKAYVVCPIENVQRFSDALKNDKRLHHTKVFQSSGALRGEFVVWKVETIPTSDPRL